MSVYHVCAQFLRRSEEGLRSPGTRVVAGGEPNLRSQGEQPVLLAPELSVQLTHKRSVNI